MAKKNVVSKAVLRAPRKLAIYLTVGIHVQCKRLSSSQQQALRILSLGDTRNNFTNELHASRYSLESLDEDRQQQSRVLASR